MSTDWVPDRADDDRDLGWGDEQADDTADPEEQLKRERPPHW